MEQRAFTLIELLVVISIIAILSAVGLVTFTNVRKSAMDAKIKSDLNAIKKAYEANYDPTANGGQGGYKPLSPTNFADGKIPTQPSGSQYPCSIGPGSTDGSFNCDNPSTQGYKITAPALSDGTTPTVVANQGTLASTINLNSCDVLGTFNNQLITYWKFDEGSGAIISNSSTLGSAKNGTWSGTTPASSRWASAQEAKVGNSAGKFSGSGDGGGVGGMGDSISFSPANNWPGITNNTLAVSGWIYPTKNNGSLLRIIGGQQYYGSSQFMLSFVNNSFNFIVNASDGNGSHASTVSSPTVSLNAWHYVVGTFDGTYAKLYVDSQPVVTGNAIFSSSLFNSAPSETFVMGRGDCSIGCRFFGGRIDDIRIYSRVLTTQEINLLASGCAP